MADLNLVGKSILRPETMLRQAQAEIDALKGELVKAAAVVARLEGQVQRATLNFCALVVQHGGAATITPEEIAATYTIKRAEQREPRASVWTVAVKDAGPKLEIVT